MNPRSKADKFRCMIDQVWVENPWKLRSLYPRNWAVACLWGCVLLVEPPKNSSSARQEPRIWLNDGSSIKETGKRVRILINRILEIKSKFAQTIILLI